MVATHSPFAQEILDQMVARVHFNLIKSQVSPEAKKEISVRATGQIVQAIDALETDSLRLLIKLQARPVDPTAQFKLAARRDDFRAHVRKIYRQFLRELNRAQ